MLPLNTKDIHKKQKQKNLIDVASRLNHFIFLLGGLKNAPPAEKHPSPKAKNVSQYKYAVFASHRKHPGHAGKQGLRIS